MTKNTADDKNPAITRFPSPVVSHEPTLSEEERIAGIEKHMREIMILLGLNLDDASLAKTPARVAKMYVKEIFSGLDTAEFPDVTFVPDSTQATDHSHLVVVKAGFTSFCEHHFVPMVGTAHIAYVPNGKLIGLSKIPRIVRYFARRPQLQERLTAQIADSLATVLETEDVAVALNAKHYCVLARGIEDNLNNTTTQRLQGRFLNDDKLRRDFLSRVLKDEG